MRYVKSVGDANYSSCKSIRRLVSYVKYTRTIIWKGLKNGFFFIFITLILLDLFLQQLAGNLFREVDFNKSKRAVPNLMAIDVVV